MRAEKRASGERIGAANSAETGRRRWCKTPLHEGKMTLFALCKPRGSAGKDACTPGENGQTIHDSNGGMPESERFNGGKSSVHQHFLIFFDGGKISFQLISSPFQIPEYDLDAIAAIFW